MPPTPFHPTHTTPFKSSISSSQQARKRENVTSNQHQTDDSQWPIEIDADQLDARHWTYLAEGGKNVILRYTGPDVYPFVNTQKGRRIALRIGKSPRQQGATNQSSSSTTTIEAQQGAQQGDNIDPSEWQTQILQPNFSDLQIDSLLPTLIRVQSSADSTSLRSFLRMVGSKIEGYRPIDRRIKSGIDSEKSTDVFILEDLSAPVPNHPCLLLEVKPKCGFLPEDNLDSVKLNPWKKTISRFRMHAVSKEEGKISKEEFGRLYDPLDLYSGQDSRIHKASSSLFTAWQQGRGSNLHIYLDGKRVEPPSLQREGEEGALGGAEILAQRLLKNADMNMPKAIHHILKSNQVQSVLTKLSELQSRYDPIDVEGLEYESQRREGKGLTERRDEDSITFAEYEKMVSKLKDSNGVSTEDLSMRELIAAFLLSTSLKDCSLFIRISEGEQEPIIQTHLVDLDPKPITKLPYLISIDREISSSFSRWATENNLSAQHQ